jgi:anhydro-N-acetylmuramic acid kinase
MGKIYSSLGLMSGTSMDGIDVSVIKSDGENKFEAVFDKFFEYDSAIYQQLTKIRDKINSSKNLKTYSQALDSLEREITLFHAIVVKRVLKEHDSKIDLIGFHGQTIFHNANEKISKQLGDGNLLSSLLRNKVVYNFRQNDLENGGQGAPLAPIFHQLLVKQNNIKLPVCILNIGGIANISIINSHKDSELKSYDVGPGNCLIDEMVRKKTDKKYDLNGQLAKEGVTSKIILDQALDNFDNIKNKKNLSFDIKDFDLSFVRGISLQNALSTLTEFTAQMIARSLLNLMLIEKTKTWNVLVAGGGRKNSFLMELVKKEMPNNININLIDDYTINGDFVESQAFGYLAIRSYLKLPISFPLTTNVKKPCTGGILAENY